MPGQEDERSEVLSDLRDFDQQFDQTESAPEGGGVIVPPNTYRCAVRDHDWIKGKETDNRGLKITFEIIEPETAKNDKGEQVEVVGKPIQNVFWITEKNLPYLKRDIKKVLGRELKSLSELAKINWTECFAELVTRNETNKRTGRFETVVSFINEWNPSKKTGAVEAPGEEDEIPF